MKALALRLLLLNTAALAIVWLWRLPMHIPHKCEKCGQLTCSCEPDHDPDRPTPHAIVLHLLWGNFPSNPLHERCANKKCQLCRETLRVRTG